MANTPRQQSKLVEPENRGYEQNKQAVTRSYYASVVANRSVTRDDLIHFKTSFFLESPP